MDFNKESISVLREGISSNRQMSSVSISREQMWAMKKVSFSQLSRKWSSFTHQSRIWGMLLRQTTTILEKAIVQLAQRRCYSMNYHCRLRAQKKLQKCQSSQVSQQERSIAFMIEKLYLMGSKDSVPTRPMRVRRQMTERYSTCICFTLFCYSFCFALPSMSTRSSSIMCITLASLPCRSHTPPSTRTLSEYAPSSICRHHRQLYRYRGDARMNSQKQTQALG